MDEWSLHGVLGIVPFVAFGAALVTSNNFDGDSYNWDCDGKRRSGLMKANLVHDVQPKIVPIV